MSGKKDLTSRVAAAMEAAAETESVTSPPLPVLAEAAREEIARWLDEFCLSLEAACLKARHPGSKRETGFTKATSCPRCRSKVAHMREAATWIGTEPDRRSVAT